VYDRPVCALSASAEQLEDVLDVGVSVFGRYRQRPRLGRRAVDLDGPATVSAGQVMVMAVAAATIGALSVGIAHHVDVTLFGHELQRPVDGRQADAFTGGA